MNDVVINQIEYEVITDAKRLEALVSQWQESEYLAIDTEFIRTSTFLAQPGLIQIADTQGVYLIDPLALQDLSPLVAVLENPNIIKIMHSMSEDVDLLFHSVGAKISRVFDTQIAASFLGLGPALGYQNLVVEVLSVELDKGETRSDWLQRPLTQSQLHYAALDVVYLLKLYDVLKPRLQEAGYFNALFDETNFLVSQVFSAWESPELGYLKLRGAWELNEPTQRLLQALVVWRDATAFRENIPKPWVFNDASLIDIVRLKPAVPADLKRIKGIQGKSIRRFSEELISTIEKFDVDLSVQFKMIDAPVKAEELVIYRRIKSEVAKISKQTGIPTQLLGSRKMLESLVIHCNRIKNKTLTTEYLGWREQIMGDNLRRILFE